MEEGERGEREGGNWGWVREGRVKETLVKPYT